MLIISIVLGFLIVFPLFWMAICYLIAVLGGWQRLASDYRTEQTSPTPLVKGLSGYLGLSNYNGSINLGVSSEGMYLSVVFLFRAGHPPLFIPWEAVEKVKSNRGIFGDFYDFRVKGVRISLPQKYFAEAQDILSVMMVK